MRDGGVHHGQNVEDWLKNPQGCVKFPLPPTDRQGYNGYPTKARDILDSVLAIENMCRSNEMEDLADLKDMRVEMLRDEPNVRYCICHSPSSALVTGYFWTVMPDITVEDARAALMKEEARSIWDGDCDFEILRAADPEDSSHEEVIFHCLKAVWPFWDRDVLQKRWKLDLPEKGGIALVMQSVEDPSIHPLQPNVIRASVHLSGQLLRPMAEGKKGIELTVCTKVDIGGIIPDWAQSILARLASQRSLNWAHGLREYCLKVNGKLPIDEDQCEELWEHEMMGL